MKFEIEIIKGLQSIGNDFFDAFFNIFSYLGSIWAVLLIAVLIFFLYDKKVGAAFLVTEGAAYLSCFILKKLVKRPRPFVVSEAIINIGSESGFSFPSGHLTASIVIAIFLFYMAFRSFKTKGRVVSSVFIVLFVLLMILDRMYLGVHYLTDTLGGVALGAVWCAVALVFLPPIGRALDRCWALIREKSKKKREQKQSNKQKQQNTLKDEKK